MHKMEENRGNNNLRTAINTLVADLCIFKIAFKRLWYNIINIVKCINWHKAKNITGTAWFKWTLAAFAVLFAILLLAKGCSATDNSISIGTDGNGHIAVTKGFSTRIPCPAKAHRISNVNYTKEFNDLNDTHIAVAEKIGVKPIQSREDAANASRTLVEISSSDAYMVDDLTHSIPFLIPEGAELLRKIGENFQDSLLMKHMSPHKVIVTSVLRTKDDVKKLRKRNTNSSENSVHCYGTTIDITYKRFLSENGEVIDSHGKLKQVLGEVLRDLKKEGCCYVKHEKKQACFHITVRKAPK